MSGRSTRKKKAPPKLIEAEDETPKASRSRKSNVKSRVSSPESRPATPALASGKRKRGRQPGSTFVYKKKEASGSSTPLNRNSRASSVSSTAKKKSTKKLKLKTKLGRGYNPNLVNYKDSEYHYGSDFEDQGYDEEHESIKSSDSDVSEIESVSDDMKPESDVELEPNLLEEDIFTPEPFWLQDPTEIPDLKLPDSSDDLPVSKTEALEAISIYEVLRQFYKILRLSPFRFEDFCTVLKNEEQSNLLSEIHICLLKALLREDDNQQVQYGPLDQKDSMNVFLYIIDSVTWPENLKFFLSVDPENNQEVIDIFNSCEYPFTSVENKLKVLKQMTDLLLSTSAIRDDLLNEGSMPLEDHCRVCHRLGDMVVCEHCNGPFHGTCLDPPLYEVPDEDWVCPVCINNMVDGVYDSLSTSVGSCRIESLGTDRHGNQYWFSCRRLFVQGREGDAWYYSTRAQLTELLEVLDGELYEKQVYDAIISQREDLEEKMDITEKLTSEKNVGNRRSYFDMDNNILDKLQKERNDLKDHQEMERRKIQEDIDRQIREEDEERNIAEREKIRKEKRERLEKIRKQREERSLKRAEMRGDGNPEEDIPDQEFLEEEDDLEQLEQEIKEMNDSTPASVVQKTAAVVYTGPRELKKGTMPPGNYFRLGEENTYKSYVNQFSIHTHALSRIQVKEEMEKKSRLSHKFSLTDVSTFKWVGSQYGTRTQLAGTVRQSILQLETNIPIAFMHTNWTLLRKPWIQAVNNCTSPGKDFARALTVLTCCIKPCILLPVWTDVLGHTVVKKIGYQGKEEKKKLEKREKKEREDEEERLRPYMTWVKYTLPVRSLSVVRQKGEEYRAHGRNGWLWISSTRNFNPKSASTLGHKLGPHRVAVKYTELKTNTSKVVLMEPKAFKFLMQVQKEKDDKALARAVAGEPEPPKQNGREVIDVEKSDEDRRRESLTKILEQSRLDLQEAGEDDLGGVDGVVDVSAGIVNPTRLLYPKTAKKGKLDDLLGRRIQLRNVEEKRFELDGSKVDTEAEKDTKTTVTSDIFTETQTQSLEAWIMQSKHSLTSAISTLLNLKSRRCYSALCRLENPSTCYSSECKALDSVSILLQASQTYTKLSVELNQRENSDLKVEEEEEEEEKKFENVDLALTKLNQVLARLKKKEEEVNDPNSLQTISTLSEKSKTAPESVLKSELEGNSLEIKPELQSLKKEKDMRRTYSNPDTSQPLYLKRIQTLADAKRPSRVVKYPLAPNFWSKAHNKRNILIQSKHDLRKLSRTGGLYTGDGYNYNSKANQAVWPYPCPRPTFKTAWMFRTAGMTSLHSVAMQLRILWMCIRWDDMSTKPPNPDAKNQITTDNEIVTTEILKHRNKGRFLEQTQYFQRRVSIPLDQPRKQVDYSPIRSGLRKRKRVESPVQAEPQVDEKWIDENELELWEIKTYRQKIERDRDSAVTRRQVGTSIKAPEKYDPSEEKKKPSSADMKAKIDVHIKEQREAYKARSTTPDLPNSKPSLAGVGERRLGDNTIKIVATNTSNPTYTNSIHGAKKIFISRDGKIIGHQLSTTSTPPGKIAIAPATPKPTLAAVAPIQASPQQKVQIVKTADGKIQVRGLLPGQQLVQMPDGKLQIFSNPPGGATPGIRLASSPVKLSSPAPVTSQFQLLPKPSTSVIQNAKTFTIQKPNTVTPIQPKPSITGIQPNLGITMQANTPRLQLIQPNTPGVIQPNTPGVIQPNQVQAAAPTPSPVKQNTLVGIQSLGQNTVSIKDGQLIVQGPDHEAATAIARQLASGQAKLANLGGKQVLLITNPNQVKTETSQPQQPPSTDAQLLNQQLTTSQQPPQPQFVSQQQIITSQPQITTQQQSLMSPPQQFVNPQQVHNTSPLQVQQQQQQGLLSAVTQPCTPLTVTAQLAQTPQGPRIILQGLQGVNLTQEQLHIIQQQVKTQLLKQQALARQQGKVPPTKVTLELSREMTSSSNQLSSPTQISNNLPAPAVGGVATPGGVSLPNTPGLQARVENTSQPSSIQRPEKPKPKIQTVSNLPESVIRQGKYVIRDGKKILVLPQQAMLEYKESLKQQESLISAHSDLSLQGDPKLLSPTEPEKFELTDDYIQQTIKEALQAGNLTPDLQEKLMNQLDDEDFKAKNVKGKRGKKKPVYDPISGEMMDEEWQPLSWKNKQTVPAPREKIREPEPEFTPSLNMYPSGAGTKKAKVRGGTHPSYIEERRRTTYSQNKLTSLLFKHKEQLKKDIAKKRSVLERELSIDISKEVESLKMKAMMKLGAESAAMMRKRKPEEQSSIMPQLPASLSTAPAPPKKSRKSDKDSSGDRKWTKDRLYCVCKTKYDETKFYVGCDVCSNWFHGSCVGITPKMSKKLSEYICDECTNAKEGTEIYCLCKQPYDEARFYIGCEQCPDWFHGRCVGILQSEAGSIEMYECPRCNPGSRINTANLRKLRAQDLENIKKLFKQIQSCKHSQPFRTPVDKKTNKKYYSVVKEPMDLETVERKLNEYNTLAEFLGDITRIVENCRYYNPPGTPISKTAENLELFVSQKLGALRDKMLQK